MRSLTYRIELDRHDGYFISNADVTSWESLPCRENFTHPPIKVSNAPIEGRRLVGNIDDYIEPPDDACDDFQEKYLQALHGEIDDWRLIAVGVNCYGATLLFGNGETNETELLYLSKAYYLRVWFDVYREDGGIDRFLFTIAQADERGEQYAVRVTEYTPFGRRQILFNHEIYCEAECPEDHWQYAYVTEYC